MLQNPLKGVVDDAPAVVQSRMYQNGRGVPQDDAEVSFLKISSAAEIVAFQPTAGYRLQHANDHHDPRRLPSRRRPEPGNVTTGKYRSPLTSGGPEAGKTTAVASPARPRVLGLPFPPVPEPRDRLE